MMWLYGHMIGGGVWNCHCDPSVFRESLVSDVNAVLDLSPMTFDLLPVDALCGSGLVFTNS